MKNNKCTRAKWGTIDWIKENKFSAIDRKRRLRVRRAVGEEAWHDLMDGVHVCCLFNKLDKVLDSFKIEIGKKNMRALEKALLTVSKFEMAIYDEAVGILLARAWGLVK